MPRRYCGIKKKQAVSKYHRLLTIPVYRQALILNTLNYKKILEIFLKLCPGLVSNPLNLKILIISCVPIWVIFQNSITYICSRTLSLSSFTYYAFGTHCQK